MNATLPTSCQNCTDAAKDGVKKKAAIVRLKYARNSRFTVAQTQFAQKTSKFGRPNFTLFECHNCCLAVAKHTFVCKTLFSRARFPVRRDVFARFCYFDRGQFKISYAEKEVFVFGHLSKASYVGGRIVIQLGPLMRNQTKGSCCVDLHGCKWFSHQFQGSNRSHATTFPVK